MLKKVRPWEQALIQLALVLVAVFVLLPVWGMFYVSFEGGDRGWPNTFRLWPVKATLEVYAKVWERSYQSMPFLSLLKNSLVMAGGAALASVSLGASMAYAFARYRFPGRQSGLFGLLLGTLLPPVALMTPLYILLSLIGIRTTQFGLVVVYTAFSMPFCIWNMRAAFQAVPKEMEESAFLDGASPLIAFLSITLPLALPSIAVAALIAFLMGYSEFAVGWMFVDKAQNVTLAMAIYGMLGASVGDSLANLAAVAVLMSLPVVTLFLALQRLLLDRLLIGGLGDE